MKMALYKLIVPLLISLCLILPMTLASKFEYCDNKDYAVKVSGVKISPNPVKKGKPATFIISATTSETITGGKLRVDVRYFGFPVYGEYHNLCEETSCPVTGGDFVVSHSQELPGFTPSGSYSLTMKMVDGEGDELTCISFGFHIGSASSVTDI
ncbi:MD-2-related lipid recognition domain-containing family protein [Salix suchowensis]|nr:MD-2-related lipid recognition domain-containing family protein [Salix suchowensis]